MELLQNYESSHPEIAGYSLESTELVRVAKALSSETRQKILKLLNDESLDVSRIASILNQTEANISAQIAILHKAALISCAYEPGGHGVRKVCSLAVNKIQINLF